MWDITVEAAQATIDEARATRGWTRATRARSFTTRCESVALIVHALALRGARTLTGGCDGHASDTTAVMSRITEVMLVGPTCLACIAVKTSHAKVDVVRAMGRMAQAIRLSVDRDRHCRMCGGSGPVYSLDRT